MNNTGNHATGTGAYANMNNTGTHATGTGLSANFSNTGHYATGTGAYANYGNTGGQATGIGTNANYGNTGNDALAYGVNANINNTHNNTIVIGNFIAATKANQIRIGGASMTEIMIGAHAYDVDKLGTKPIVQNHYTQPKVYPSATDTHLDVLDTAITVAAGEKVKLTATKYS